MSFPKDFLIGAATAAHQVEGNNIHSDYWAQEQMPHSGFAEPSLDACDHYNRFEEDIALLAKAGLNAYRFSIEWARIEPEEGRFDPAEVEHYRQVIACCKANGVEPIVTLHHFSSPVWLIRKGGWEAETVVEDFARYAAFVTKELGSELHYICTINEANMGIQVAAVAKRYMQQMMAAAAKMKAGQADSSVQVGINLEQLMANQKLTAEENVAAFGTPNPQTFVSGRTPEGDILVMKAHQAAKKAIKERFPDMKVGLTLSLHDMQPLPGGEAAAQKEWDDELLHYLPYIENDDFLGVQNYTRTRFDENGTLPAPDGAETTQMGYEYYPEAIGNVIREVSKVFHNDLIVTENGVATADDTRRVEYIRRALDGVQACVDEGIPVKGYYYWSLMDNFEWQKGFAMQFGLIAVDRKNGQTRIPKESLRFLGSYTKGE
ncbi:MAG: glycoside hydrolase family 1 protein [Ruminococcaceae bacterium]|nr:glycoside hydrolase family 1 protein [Oscillospiraceae bacterium]